MKILIVGAGLSGCSLARLLVDKGHNVQIIEKKDRVGGLCITDIDKYGLMYEPYGARTFHTKNQKIIDFVSRFDEFNGYTHRKGMIVNGKLFPFPITRDDIKYFDDSNDIFLELDILFKREIDKTNFETVCLSIFGKTLYNYFIRNYTQKMWGVDPKELSAEWAPKRLEFREDSKDGLFAQQWQGLPVHGYSFFLERMIEGIPIELNSDKFDNNEYDVVVSTVPLDEMMDYKFGRLQYRSFRYDYAWDEEWENNEYGTINLPQHKRYVRKCNFKILHKQQSEHSVIQYQEPLAADEINVPMYPLHTKENSEAADRYLKDICGSKNICPHGRLGLFKYLDMDKAIEVSHDIVELVEGYLILTDEERYNVIQEIRNRY